MKEMDTIAQQFGKLVLLGSGETSPAGKTILRKVLLGLPRKQVVAIVETPAGFQPNSAYVAKKIANLFTYNFKEFVSTATVIAARKKGTRYSPNSAIISKPLKTSTFIFLGPGSPTYTVKQLANSKTFSTIVDRFTSGATLCLSSAAVLAVGRYTLPVYEIYKVGAPLYWEKGLNLFKLLGLDVTIITHFNNREGGEHFDTRYCYMGRNRFHKLRKLLPLDSAILGIDENTALILDVTKQQFTVEGQGVVTLLKGKKRLTFNSEHVYNIASLTRFANGTVSGGITRTTPQRNIRSFAKERRADSHLTITT